MSITIFKYPMTFPCYLLLTGSIGGITVLKWGGKHKMRFVKHKNSCWGGELQEISWFFYCLAYFRAYLVLFCVILRHLEDPSHLVENHRYRLLLLTGAWKPLVTCAAWNFLLCFLDNESHMILERYEGAFHLGWTVPLRQTQKLSEIIYKIIFKASRFV